MKLSRLMTKPTKWHVRPAKTQISLGIRLVWSESSLSAWRRLWSLATNWTHSEDSDQTGWMPRLIWVFAGGTVILLVLSWGASIKESVFGHWNNFLACREDRTGTSYTKGQCANHFKPLHLITKHFIISWRGKWANSSLPSPKWLKVATPKKRSQKCTCM